MPLGRWGRGELRSFLEPRPRGRVAEILDPGFTGGLATEHMSGAVDRAAALHSVAFLERWLERWV